MKKKLIIITSALLLSSNSFISFVHGYGDNEYVNQNDLAEILLPSSELTEINDDYIIEDPDAGITYTDTNGRIFSGIGTITIISGDESITILDRNLGATSTDIYSQDSYGYHFQRGNNYGFTWVSNESKDFLLDETIVPETMSNFPGGK